MRRWLFRLLVLLPLGVALLAAGAYFLVDRWLESAGGRRALETALGDRLGVPVSLAGEFNVMLLPEIGVDGTELFIGVPGAATEVAFGREFAVALALRPLFRKQLVVDSVYLAGGRFYLERWPATEGTEEGGVINPPEIRYLEVEEFDLLTSEGGGLGVRSLRVDNFQAGVDTPFELAVVGYGMLDGRFLWDREGGSLTLAGEWTGWLPGRTRIEGQALFAQERGSASANWEGASAAADSEERLAVRFDFALVETGIRFDGLRLEAGEQFVEGAGCVRFEDPPRLDFELRTPRIDLDRLPDFGPFTEALSAGEGNDSEAVQAPGPGPGLNVRLRAGEAQGQGVVAYDAMFLLGDEPDCRELSATPDSSGMTAVPVTVQ